MKKKMTTCVIIGLIIIIAVMAMIPIQYQATGIFLRCLDGKTYMVLSDGTHYAHTTYPKNPNDVVNDDVMANYDTIDLDDYATSHFTTGDILKLTRESNVIKQIIHRVWLYAHTRVYKIETTNNFDDTSKKHGIYFNIPIQPAIRINDGTLAKTGQLTETQIKDLDDIASEVSKRRYLGSYHYDNTCDMPDIIGPNDILWQ